MTDLKAQIEVLTFAAFDANVINILFAIITVIFGYRSYHQTIHYKPISLINSFIYQIIHKLPAISYPSLFPIHFSSNLSSIFKNILFFFSKIRTFLSYVSEYHPLFDILRGRLIITFFSFIIQYFLIFFISKSNKLITI